MPQQFSNANANSTNARPYPRDNKLKAKSKQYPPKILKADLLHFILDYEDDVLHVQKRVHERVV